MPVKYPPVTDATLVPLRAIEVQLGAAPDMLDRPECPYPTHIKTFLKKLLQPSAPVERKEYTDDELEKEIHDLYSDLRSMVIPSDAKDAASVMKTRVDLLQRMVALKERFLNTRQMSAFQRIVLECLEVLDPTTRNEFMEKLGQHAVR